MSRAPPADVFYILRIVTWLTEYKREARYRGAMARTASSRNSFKEPVSGKVIVTLVIGLAIGAFFHYDLGRFLSLSPLQDHRDKPLAFGDTADVARIGIFMVAGLSFPGTAILRRAGDVLFSAALGTLFVHAVAATGATLTS